MQTRRLRRVCGGSEVGVLDVAVDLVVTVLVLSATMATVSAALGHSQRHQQAQEAESVTEGLHRRQLLVLQTSWDPAIDGLVAESIPTPLRDGMSLLDLVSASIEAGWLSLERDDPRLLLLAAILWRSYGVAYPDAHVAVLLCDSTCAVEGTNRLLFQEGEFARAGVGASTLPLPVPRSSASSLGAERR